MPAAKHILIPIHDFSAGGTELIAFRLARRWVEDGRQVTLLAGARDGPMRQRVPDGVSVRILSPERPRRPWSRLFLGRQMAPDAAALAPDLIFIPGNFHFGLARAFKAVLPATPIVAKISNPLLTPPLDGAPELLTRPVLRMLTRGIDWFAAMSAGLAAEARAQLGHDRVSTLYDPNLDDDAAIDFTERPTAVPGGAIRLIAIGRLEAQKNFSLALRTLAALRLAGHAAGLRIFGEGPLRKSLEEEAARLGLDDAVEMPGFSQRVHEEIAQADMLLVSSRYEGGPAVAVEALSQGVPTVSTDCSHFLRDLIVSPAFGTLVRAQTPQALAAAILEQRTRPGPSPEEVSRRLAQLRLGETARAYLSLFDSLGETHART